MGIFSDFRQNLELTAQSSHDLMSAADSHEQSRKLDSVRQHLRFVSLASEAVIELMAERLGVSEADIRRKMKEIDARDGKADGRIASRPVPCTKCGRNVDTAKPACLYCGHPVDAGEFFEAQFH